MPKGFAAFALLCVSAAQDDDVARDAVRGYRHPWSGFGAGSTVTTQETYKAVIYSPATGKSFYKDVSRDVVWTVVKEDGREVTVRMKGGSQESYIPFPLSAPGSFRGKGERKGLQEVRVGDRKYLCSVTAISLDMDKDAGQMTTICRSSDAPHWAVRYVVETFLRGERNTSEEELLVGVNENVRVGGREVVCQVIQVTTERPGGQKTVRLEWRSDDVPGRVARRQTREFSGGKEIEGSEVKMDVVSFSAKK